VPFCAVRRRGSYRGKTYSSTVAATKGLSDAPEITVTGTNRYFGIAKLT